MTESIDRNRETAGSAREAGERGSRGRRSLGPAAFISSALVLPFVVLEVVNRPGFPANFPIVLFAVMWLLVMAFVMILAPVVRNARAGGGMLANPTGLLMRTAFLIPIAAFWLALVVDQMPCFLGVPNCD